MKLHAERLRRDRKGAFVGWITLQICALSFFLVLVPFLIIFLSKRESFVYLVGFNSYGQLIDCYADGTAHFNAYYYTDPAESNHLYSPFNAIFAPSVFLSITLGFGSFRLPVVKAIDVTWDLVAGRGGQLLLIFTSYPILHRTLLLLMEQRPVSFNLCSSLAFSGFSFSSLFALSSQVKGSAPGLGGAARSSGSSRSRNWIHVALIVVSVYIMFFPTILSAMTGYQSQLVPYVRNPNDTNSLMNGTILSQWPDITITDAERINLTTNFSLDATATGYPIVSLYAATQLVLNDNSGYGSRSIDCPTVDLAALNAVITNCIWTVGSDVDYAGCPCNVSGTKVSETANPSARPQAILWSLSTPEDSLAFWQLQNSTGTFNTDQLASNITIFGSTHTLEAPPLSVDPQAQSTWGIGGVPVSLKWAAENTVCEPGPSYLWGFSASMLLTFCGMSALFVILLTTLHWVVYNNSQADRYEQPVSIYRDVLDLATELRSQLGVGADDMSGDELNAAVKKTGGSISLDTSTLALSRREERSMRRRANPRGENAREPTSPSGVRGIFDTAIPRGLGYSKAWYGKAPTQEEHEL